MKPIKNLPSSNDDRYVADVIRDRNAWRSFLAALDPVKLLILRVLVVWRAAEWRCGAITVQGWPS